MPYALVPIQLLQHGQFRFTFPLIIGLFLGIAIWPYSSLAADSVRIERPLSSADKRSLYKNAILQAALDATVGKFGSYTIETAVPVLSPSRAMLELVEGKLINTYITSTSEEWESKAIPIHFPLRRGLTGYRLVLVHKDKVESFRKVRTAADLKKFVSGTISVGSVARALMHHQFNIVKSSSFDGAFYMLAAQRFDFISRGVNEIFREIESGHPAFEDIVIVPDIALHLPLISYIFVSPKYPQLAERFRQGMTLIHINGTFDAIFNQFHGESLERAALEDRHIIYLENPNLPQSSLHLHKGLVIKLKD